MLRLPPVSRLFSVCFSLLLLNFAFMSEALSQTFEKKKIIAVQTIVSMLLMDDDGGGDVSDIEVEIGPYSSKAYSFDEEFSINFPQHSNNRDIEVCFVMSGSNLSNLQVSLNGQTTSQSLTTGENCFKLPASSLLSDNTLTLTSGGGARVSVSGISIELASQSNLTLPRLTRSGWDERAVRKVLKVFALGGHALDSQINAWANMPPQSAIKQMLNFNQHNLRLSPILRGDKYNATASQYGTLSSFANFLSSPNSKNPIPLDNREIYGLDGYAFPSTFARMITTRGLNPFRQRIGYWETNYHLAVNMDASVSRRQIATYYDDIMQMHASGASYEKVMGVAAKSAAVAMQYGHRRNECEFDSNLNDYVCEVNEDFGREIHQLFYGIFGLDDPDHETVTIKETAKMLTGMPVDYIQDFGFDTKVSFNAEDHHRGSLNILGRTISGSRASRKIDNLMPISINHPESLRNLPVMIISVLADDNLDETRSDQVRAAWAAMGSHKNFLRFIQAYATSKMFHSPDQVKYFTSFERAVYTSNKLNLNNLEALLGGSFYFTGGAAPGRSVTGIIQDDNAGSIFRPLHNVFGGQTSFEAADSAGAFEQNYNRSTENSYHTQVGVQCDDCDLGNSWEKSWQQVLPTRGNRYRVKDVARWLWKHAVGNLDNYSSLEKAHLYAILGAARHAPGETYNQDFFFDLPLLVCIAKDYRTQEPAGSLALDNLLDSRVWYRHCAHHDGPDAYSQAEKDMLNAVYTGEDIENDPIIQILVTNLGNRSLPLTSSNPILRERSRERIQSAMGFIFATPFIFAEGE